MIQIYAIIPYNASFYSIISLEMPYFTSKKFTRASFLLARLKSVGIRFVRLSVRFDAFRLGKKKPRTVTGPGLFITESLSKERVGIGSSL